jgi:hypothetical protein
MKSAANRPTHITHGNVMDDLGFSPENATAVKFKAELYRAILKYARKYSQSDSVGTAAAGERIAEWEDREQERGQTAVLRGSIGHRG